MQQTVSDIHIIKEDLFRMCLPTGSSPKSPPSSPHPRPMPTLKPGLTASALNWRSPGCQDTANLNLSVVKLGKRTSQNYSVHQSIVADGPRKSNFLEAQLLKFKHDPASTSVPRSFTFELDDEVADCFEGILDFQYGSALPITTETSMFFRYLSEKLMMPEASRLIWEFIKKDMSVRNLERYLKESRKFNDKQCSTWVAFECAKYINEIPLESNIWKELTTEEFKHVVFLAGNCHVANSMVRSEIIAKYCSHHVKSLDAAVMKELTSSHLIPVISPKVAMYLMEMESHLRRSSRRMSVSPNVPTPNLSSLQRRCIKALANVDLNSKEADVSMDFDQYPQRLPF